MAFWSKKETELQETYHTIEQHPGLKPTELAQQLGVASSTIQRRLPSLEDAGFLLSEDERGAVVLCKKKQVKFVTFAGFGNGVCYAGRNR